jgi:ribosomal protein S6
MTLYELIVLAKCAASKNTANLARNIANTIISKGGNVREVRILSDRYLNYKLFKCFAST